MWLCGTGGHQTSVYLPQLLDKKKGLFLELLCVVVLCCVCAVTFALPSSLYNSLLYAGVREGRDDIPPTSGTKKKEKDEQEVFHGWKKESSSETHCPIFFANRGHRIRPGARGLRAAVLVIHFSMERCVMRDIFLIRINRIKVRKTRNKTTCTTCVLTHY